MAKSKSTYVCSDCGFESVKWLGKCPSCNNWNSFIEETSLKITEKQTISAFSNFSTGSLPRNISDVNINAESRIDLEDVELNRVLGGGLVKGSVVLIGGEPGIGKSTLMLQIAIKSKFSKVLYVSGEESENQIKLRADRIGILNENCFLLNETNVQSILKKADQLLPDFLIIDSIQTLFSSNIDSISGSVSQLREATSLLVQFAKEKQVPIFLIGHVTKQGTIAGPKLLEHMVDTVLHLEGDGHHIFRMLRNFKNRFGNTQELGIYEMNESGLNVVKNPSESLVSSSTDNLSGISVASMTEGIRPFLIEVQALVSTAAYGTPQRSTNGFDSKRLNMLLAVLEKRCGFLLATKDVFLNIAGGIHVDDTAIDLAVVSSILSSNVDIPIQDKIVFAGEVGLTGELRQIPRLNQRIQEAEKLGYSKCIIPFMNKKIKSKNLDLIYCKSVIDLPKILFS